MRIERPDVCEGPGFIESLKLAAPEICLAKPELPSRSVFARVPGETEAAYVHNGLVSFVAGTCGRRRSDVLNSTLLAQLAADKRYDRETQTLEWYRLYRSVMRRIGWTIEDFAFQQYEASGETARIHRVIVELLDAVATRDRKEIVCETLRALRVLSRAHGRLTHFHHTRGSATAGAVRTGDAPGGGRAFPRHTRAGRISDVRHSTRFLWFGYSKVNVRLYKGVQATTLDEQILAGMRDRIREKLERFPGLTVDEPEA